LSSLLQFFIPDYHQVKRAFRAFDCDIWDALLRSGSSTLQAEQGDPATRCVNELLIYLEIKLN
jgi:hypothetical protein